MIYHGDLFDVLPTLEAESIDACVTDGPYGIGFMGKKWDSFKPGEETKRIVPNRQIDSDNPNLKGRTRGPASSPSAVEYDYSVKGLREFQAFTEAWGREVLRVLKPGAYIVSCGAPRSHHRMMCGLEDAGFVVRDCFAWLFGSGFPKNYNLGDGKGTALKPAHEPIALAWKPFKGTITNCHEQYGTAALNIDACRIEGLKPDVRVIPKSTDPQIFKTPSGTHNGEMTDIGRWPANVLLDEWDEQVLHLKYNTPTDAARVIREYFDGYGELPPVRSALRDVSEPCETGTRIAVQPILLRDMAEREPERREPSHEGETTLAVLDCEDAPLTEGSEYERGEQSRMERREAHLARVRDGRADAAIGAGTSAICVDGEAQQQSVHTGASASGCAEARATIDIGGSCASSEREQAGQPLQQSGTSQQRHTQEGPSIDPSGAAAPSRGERAFTCGTLEVLESDIPRPWLIYFAPTGKSVRRGAAAMLDEQAPLTGSAGAKDDRGRFHGIHDGRSSTRDDVWGEPRDDRSGASRFYYVAKPSREERDFGTEGLIARQRDESRKDGNPGGDNPRNRGLQPRGNFHPTVKPVELMRWLVKLVTPPDGLVLDPFTGSGTTGMACRYEHRRFVGIEREADYIAIAERRIAAVAPLFGEASA